MRKVGSLKRLPAGLAVLTGVTLVVLWATSLAGAAKVNPIFIDGASNKTCSEFAAPGQTWIELKVDPNEDGTFSDGTLTVTIQHTQEDKVFDWSSNIGVDAVFAKGGSDGSYLYVYDPPSEQTSDTGLTTPGQNAISHISFCYDNNPKGSLTVVKRVDNGDGGDAAPGDWTMNVAGPTPLSFPGASDPGTTNQVDPGAYTVTESGGPSGYTLSYSGDCDASGNVTVPTGGSATCVLTNTEEQQPPEPGTIIVEKQTDPDGHPRLFDFTSDFAGSFSLSDGQTKETTDLEPGTYSVSEAALPGWRLLSATCSDGSDPSAIVLSAGEKVTCVFTNQRYAKIIVEKQTNPDGDPTVFDFDASWDEEGFSLSDGESHGSSNLVPGTYSVSENVPDGWNLTDATCSDESHPAEIELSAGEIVTCVFTNTKESEPETGTIIVEKQTDPNGDTTEFDFVISAGEGSEDFSLSDGEQATFDELDPGTYSVVEYTPAGWYLASAVCDDESASGEIELSAGETVTCVFTNVKQSVGRGSILVSKEAFPKSIKEPGGPVTFSVTITNTSADVDVQIQDVVDDKFGDLDDSGGNGCFDVPINLKPGEKVNCTFEKTISGEAGADHVNVVCADAVDAYGNPLKHCDDARVTITPRLIDLVLDKQASSPTPLNGTVNYTLTVTNKGPDTATNVQLADPAPAGISYLTANPSQGTCSVSAALVTCALGTIAPGQTVTVAVTARATSVGSHTNTATVTGSGGQETNPADNVDSAVTVVPAPLTPPTKPKPKPKPEVDVCLALTVTPKMVTADGKPDKVVVKVTAGKKAVKGVKVVVKGAGVEKGTRTNAKGVAVLTINPKKSGLITVTVAETNKQVCGPKRIGVVGVFLPPLTG